MKPMLLRMKWPMNSPNFYELIYIYIYIYSKSMKFLTLLIVFCMLLIV